MVKNKKMNVVFCASEMAPFAKSGGLGDVIGALPPMIAQENIEVKVFLPKYSQIDTKYFVDVKFEKSIDIFMNNNKHIINILSLKKNNITVYFLEHSMHFERQNFYGYYGHFDDNERFSFFTKAIFEALIAIDFRPDIMHFHDWQTALGPLILNHKRQFVPFFKNTKSVMTIHNLQYQGEFSSDMLYRTGLEEFHYDYKNIEFYGRINYLKAGIMYADIVTTVSERYAEEIKTYEYGHGLDGVISNKNIVGVLNGIDEDTHNPKTSPYVYKNFDIDSIKTKKQNKKLLQQELELEETDAPLVAIISRLADQKGFDIIQYCLHEILNINLQLVVLGTGQYYYEHMFKSAEQNYSGRVKILTVFDESLASKIYAGSDFFLMPSRFEPCGLSQMFAMKNGSVPIVRYTGGLADTVSNYNENTKEGSGFVFTDYNHLSLLGSIKRGISQYNKGEKEFYHLIKNCMDKDFSWKVSAKKYVELYESILNQ